MATSAGSTFTLNGNGATGAEISNKVGELNVAVANLWYVPLHPCFPLWFSARLKGIY